MAIVHVNGTQVDIGNERLNLIQAALRAGVFIPYYCWHPGLTVVASCRMCLVEAGEMKDGQAVMQPRVVPACQTPAKDGTVIVTNGPKARAAQKQTLEDLLLNHPLDCPVCDKAGECLLQDYSYRFGKSQSRMIDDKNTPPNKDYIGENIFLFADRCIMCSRCVRFTREISGTAELQIINRGHHSEIDIFPGEPCNNHLATNVVDLCPVGALCSKDFMYKQRVWNLKSQKSVCPDCSTGCSIHVDHNKQSVYRLRPRENAQAQGYFMCDLGRLGYHYINAPERLKKPIIRRDGQEASPPWPDVIAALRKDLMALATRKPGALAAVLSPYLTCEEAFLLAKFLKGLSKQVRLVLGPVPVLGEDDLYPKDVHGKPKQPVKFTIHAEKCPNRRGVEAVMRHFESAKPQAAFQDIVTAAERGEVEGLYIAAGYPPADRGRGAWIDEKQVAALAEVPLLIVQDIWPTSLSSATTTRYVLPGVSFAEKEGTFVNHAGLAQEIRWAIAPPGDARPDGQILLDLMERRGLVHAPTIRKEMATEVAYFAPLAGVEIGEYGVMLPWQGERET
jgi:NADH-quinone oxidoreductase subunit G